MISISHVSKRFIKSSGKKDFVVHALDDVNLEIQDHEFVCLIGPSGCGKTTLLKMVDGLATYDSGRIEIDGVPISTPGPDRAVVFQTFALLPWRTVLSNVEFGLEARGVAREVRRPRAQDLIARVGLSLFESHYPHELSGGMQQRAGLARALAVEPKILLMDEPFGALDEQTRRVLQNDLARFWEIQRQTVLFVTHSMDEAVYLADKIVIMSPRPGQIIEELVVPFARPRVDEELRKSPEFAELTEYVWRRIKGYSMAASASV